MLAHVTGSRTGLLRSFLSIRSFVAAVFVLSLAISRPAFAQTATTTTLSITNGSSEVTSVASGTVVTLTATVLVGSTPVTPGQVKFCDAAATYCEDFHILGTAQLTSSGTAILKFRPTVGSHSYKAVFAGTNANATSISATSALSVTGLNPTTTSLAYSDSNSELTATVAGTGGFFSAVPTGTVSFLNAANSDSSLGSASLTSTGLAYWPSTLPAFAASYQAPGFSSPAVADFNGDGIPDVAIFNSNGLVIYLGSTSGTFTEVVTPATIQAEEGDFFGAQLFVGDFNQDGIPDLAAYISAMGNYYVEILKGNGDGTFTAGATYPASPPNNPQIRGADFNHDGIPDLAVLEIDPHNPTTDVTILLGNGDGTFSELTGLAVVPNFEADFNYEFAVGDFNGDGIPDIAITGGLMPGTGIFPGQTIPPTALYTYLGNGDGTFNPTPSFTTTLSTIANISVDDFNGDGKPDILLDSGQFFLGTGNGNFTAEPNANAPATPYIGNFSGSGNAQPWAGAAFMYNSATGTFNEVTGIPSFSGASLGEGSLAADVNGDGITDFVSPFASPGVLYVTGSVSSGSVSTSDFPSGGYTILANYPGDSDFAPSTASISSPQPPALTLSVLPNSSLTAAQAATFTATLTPYFYSGGSTNGESVSFYEDGYVAGAGTLSNGVATFTIQQLTVGTHTFYAVYPGDSSFSSSTSSSITVTVSKAQPTLALSATPNPGIYGQVTTLTATLSGNYGSPNGQTITFYNQGKAIGTGTLSAGTANISLSTLALGTHSLTATYPGDGYDLGATSNTVPYTVTEEPPVLTSPAPGSVLSGSTVTFQWTPGSGVTAYSLSVGTYGPGYFNLGGSPQLSSSTTSYTVINLPTDSKPVYITLRYQINGVWQTTDYTYTAAPLANPPAITSPTPGGVLSGSSVTFTWQPSSAVTAYSISAGTYGPGYFNLGGSPQLPASATSYTLTNLPTDGKPVYITLRYLVNGAVWQTADYTYTAAPLANPPAITSPTPGSVLSGSSVTFTWQPSSAVTAYSISAGTYGPGYFNLGGSPQLPASATSYTLTNLPTDGKPVYITLRYLVNGAVWQTTDYTYTAASSAQQPPFLTPTPGSMLTGPGATFGWNLGNLNVYMVTIQVTDTNFDQLYEQSFFDESDIGGVSVGDIPTNGETVYVYLSWYTVDGSGDGQISAGYSTANLSQLKQVVTQIQ